MGNYLVTITLTTGKVHRVYVKAKSKEDAYSLFCEELDNHVAIFVKAHSGLMQAEVAIVSSNVSTFVVNEAN